MALNRKCKGCDSGIPTDKHDCRKNFVETVKTMDSCAAAELVRLNYRIFNESNIQVGVIFLDDDSSSICAIKNVCHYEIIKHSDKNHTSKRVVNVLYKMKKKIIKNEILLK